jgi:hypothetical protein
MSASSSEPEPKRTKSGNHPAVKSYRRKLESISERRPLFDELDKEIEEDLRKVRSTPPPPPDDPAGEP